MAAFAWTLYVERVWPENAAEIDQPPNPNEPHELIARREKARLALVDIRSAIYPED